MSAENPQSKTPEQLDAERAQLLETGDATAMEIHMAKNGAHDALIAGVAKVLQGEDQNLPSY